MADTGYLFQCGSTDMFAVSRDKAGSNIPTVECRQGWSFRDVVTLDVRDPLLSPHDMANLRKALDLYGFYIWRESDLRAV
jgi:hypothetical protein